MFYTNEKDSQRQKADTVLASKVLKWFRALDANWKEKIGVDGVMTAKVKLGIFN